MSDPVSEGLAKVTEEVNEIVLNAKVTAAEFHQYTQEQVDRIVKACAEAGFDNRVQLAKMANEETGIGKWQDKVLKNVLATHLLYQDIKDEKTVGVINVDRVTGITEIAHPMGPIFAVIPVTNPTSTVFFKILICLKSRNPIIISPARKACNSSITAAKIMYEAALNAGAPEHCIQWIDSPSREATKAFMTHPDIALILATGGPSLVKSAYSSGTPALGVGAGNVPVFIDKSADADFAASQIIASKTFDYGTVCASEQAVVFEKSIKNQVIDAFKKHKAYMLSPAETELVTKVVFDKDRSSMSPDIVGKSAVHIATVAGVSVPEDTTVLVAEVDNVGKDSPLSHEILAPVLAFYCVDTFHDAINRCIDLNYFGGVGHSASIFANDEDVILRFSSLMNAGRIVVNTPSSQGGVGGIFNMLRPSFTLGCGTGGKNATTDNVTAKHLINIQRVARRRDNRLFLEFDQSKFFDESQTLADIVTDYFKNS